MPSVPGHRPSTRAAPLPLFLSSELPENDGPPLRTRILCEDLVGYRDTNGNANSHSDRNTNSYSNRNANSYPYCHSVPNSITNCNSIAGLYSESTARQPSSLRLPVSVDSIEERKMWSVIQIALYLCSPI